MGFCYGLGQSLLRGMTQLNQALFVLAGLFVETSLSGSLFPSVALLFAVQKAFPLPELAVRPQEFRFPSLFLFL